MACQERVTFFGRDTSYTLDSADIILTGATAGSERAPQRFLLMQSTTICLLLGRRFVWGAIAWVVGIGIVSKRALYIALSGAGHRTAERESLCRGGGGAPTAPLDPRL